MGISRHFLGTSRPALAAAASYLIERFANGSELDLSSTVVVVPGSRASRRLLELLVQLAGERWPGMRPPRILTFAAFPELLYPPQKPFADDFTQLLVWRQALFSCPEQQLQAALPRRPRSGRYRSMDRAVYHFPQSAPRAGCRRQRFQHGGKETSPRWSRRRSRSLGSPCKASKNISRLYGSAGSVGSANGTP